MSNKELRDALDYATKMVVTPEEVVKIRFEGFGSPEEVRKQQQEKIERVRRHKNKKARDAAQRTNALLADLGLSRKERQAIGKRQRAAEQSKKHENYRWSPEAQS